MSPYLFPPCPVLVTMMPYILFKCYRIFRLNIKRGGETPLESSAGFLSLFPELKSQKKMLSFYKLFSFGKISTGVYVQGKPGIAEQNLEFFLGL